jgi:ubiquitin-protein ligase
MRSGIPSSARALKRIQRDLNEMECEPVGGIGIAKVSSDDDFLYVVNIKIMDGIYEGIIVQMEMTIPETFPVNAPKMLIYPGQSFGQEFHHHIYEGPKGYKKFCVDILGDAVMDSNAQKSGWSPAYTFRTLFMQIQNFLADPDGRKTSNEQIEKMKEQMKSYTRNFTNDKGEIILHTHDSPYPSLGEFQAEKKLQDDSIEELKLNRLKNNLTCFLVKTDYISDNKMIMGYPLMLQKTKGGILEINPIPELLSYEGYITELQANPNKLSNFQYHNFKTASGEYYNYWLPIYLNEEHYQTNKTLIFNSISVCKFGLEGKAEYDFQPLIVLEIIPALLNKMIIFLLQGMTHLSLSAMRAYCHYIMLLVRLIEDFPELKKYIQIKIECGMENLSKQHVPDIGNLIVLMLFSQLEKEISYEKVFPILEEFFTRQVFWNFEHRTKNIREVIKSLLLKDKNIKIAFLLDKYAKIHDKVGSLNHKFLYDQKNYIEKNKSKLQGHVTYKPIFESQFNIYTSNQDFFTLIDASSAETKSKIYEEVYKNNKGNELFLYTYKAAQKFMNKEYIQILRKTYCTPEEGDLEDFIKSLNEIKSSIKNYKDLTKELGYESYFEKENDIFPFFLKFCSNSNKRKYSSIPISKDLLNKYSI